MGRDSVVTDPKNQVYAYVYNALGWLIKQVDPVGARDTDPVNGADPSGLQDCYWWAGW
jgi:YD repeat-containing protein